MIRADKRNIDANPPSSKDLGRFITVFTDASYCPETSAYGCAYWIKDKTDVPTTHSNGGAGIGNAEQAEIKALNDAISWLLAHSDLANRIVILQSDCLGALRKCQYYKLHEKVAFVKLKHVKGHSSQTTKRSYVNKLCDRMAKEEMKKYRDEVYRARGTA